MLEQSEGVIVAEVAASPRWSEDASAAAAVKTRSGRLVVGAEAAHHSNDEANAAATEFEHADGRLVAEGMKTRTPQLLKTEQAENRLVAEATATCNRGVDTNAAAAASKEKTDRTEVMSRSQEKKNEKTNEGADEIKRLIGERQTTVKGDRHQLKESSGRCSGQMLPGQTHSFWYGALHDA